MGVGEMTRFRGVVLRCCDTEEGGRGRRAGRREGRRTQIKRRLKGVCGAFRQKAPSISITTSSKCVGDEISLLPLPCKKKEKIERKGKKWNETAQNNQCETNTHQKKKKKEGKTERGT